MTPLAPAFGADLVVSDEGKERTAREAAKHEAAREPVKVEIVHRTPPVVDHADMKGVGG